MFLLRGGLRAAVRCSGRVRSLSLLLAQRRGKRASRGAHGLYASYRVARVHRGASRAASLGWEGKLTIVSTSMVASTTHTATSILTSMERPEATSMVSMVSIVPPTQLFCCLVRRKEMAA